MPCPREMDTNPGDSDPGNLKADQYSARKKEREREREREGGREMHGRCSNDLDDTAFDLIFDREI